MSLLAVRDLEAGYGGLVAEVEGVLARMPQGVEFVFSHPIAGREKVGVAFADALDLPDRECGRGRRVEHAVWRVWLFLAGT